MSNRPRGIAPNAQAPVVQIDLNQLEELVCSNCASDKFVQMLSIRRLPALLSPNKQEGITMTPAGIACVQCGSENTARPKSLVKLGGDDNGADSKVVR
jgi:hypothetical protein